MQSARVHESDAGHMNGGLPAPRVLWLEALCVATVVLLQLGPSPVQVILVLMLMAWALTSAHGIIQSLSLMVLIFTSNPDIVAIEPQIFFLKWVLIFICFLRVVLAGKRRDRKGPAWVPLFGVLVGVITILTLLVSYDRFLSGFKLISFAAGAIAALLSVAIDTRPPRYWLNWFFTVHCVVVFLSVPALLLPAGYLFTTKSFRGIFAHPQAFGVYLAIWCSYLITYILTSRRASPFLLLVTGLTTYFIFASHCRTAMLAIAASVVIAGLTALLSPRGGRNNFNSWTVARFCTVVFFAVALLAYDALGVSGSLKDFALKGHSGGSGDDLIALLSGSFEGSRGEQVRSMVDSIAVHPIAGVGFGVAPAGVVQEVERDSTWGLPVSAPLEQGFLPLAVLAQIGIIGALVLGVFLFKLAAPLVKFAPAPVLAMFSTALLINIGEMIFFSTGSLGLQMWLIFGVCHEYAAREGQLAGNREPHVLWRRVLIGMRQRGIGYAR